MSTITERWPAGMAVEIRNLDEWLPAMVIGADYCSQRALRGKAGERVEVELATGQRALIAEAYNGRASIRARGSR